MIEIWFERVQFMYFNQTYICSTLHNRLYHIIVMVRVRSKVKVIHGQAQMNIRLCHCSKMCLRY